MIIMIIMIIIIMATIIIMTITAQIITIIRTNGCNHVIFYTSQILLQYLFQR